MNKVKVQESKIHGLGLFADQEFNEGDMIGLAHYNGVPSEIIGKYHNHSDNPNAHSVTVGNKRFLVALNPLRKGEEITVDYREQPELEQPEEFAKGGLVNMPKPSKKGLASKRYSRDLTATNRLFTKNKLLQKPKSKKRKIYDPNAKYYQDGGIVELDGYRFKKDANGNWIYESGAPVTDRGMIQRLTYEAKPVGSPVVQSRPKPSLDKPVNHYTTINKLKNSPVLADQEKVKKAESLALEELVYNPVVPNIRSKEDFPNDVEGLIDEALNFPEARARIAAKAAVGPGEDPSDPFRHSNAARYTAESIKDYVADVPYQSIPLIGDAVNEYMDNYVAPGLGFLGANLLGLAHEASIFVRDARPVDIKYRESFEDMYNNYVGAKTGASDMSPEAKTNYLLYLNRTNRLPDGVVPKPGSNKNLYIKSGPNDPGKFKSSYEDGGELDTYPIGGGPGKGKKKKRDSKGRYRGDKNYIHTPFTEEWKQTYPADEWGQTIQEIPEVYVLGNAERVARDKARVAEEEAARLNYQRYLSAPHMYLPDGSLRPQAAQSADWVWQLGLGAKPSIEALNALAAVKIPYTGISLGTAANVAGGIHGATQVPQRIEDWQEVVAGNKNWKEAAAETAMTALELGAGAYEGINALRFKPDPNMYYRGIGSEGYEDAINTGLLRQAGFDNKNYNNYKDVWYATGNRGFAKARDFSKDYIAEVPRSAFPETGDEFFGSALMPIRGTKKHIPIEEVRILKKNWLRGYKEVPKELPGSPNASIMKSGMPNPLALADAIVPRLPNPIRIPLLGAPINEVGPFTGSPLNFLPGYGKTLGQQGNAFRKFGNTMEHVQNTKTLSPKGGSSFRIGKEQIANEGNWAAMNNPWEHYPGTFAAEFDFAAPGSNLGYRNFADRNGVLITDRAQNTLVDIPITDPGLSFHRRLPFSNRYVPINKEKLLNNQFQLATQGGHFQSLVEKYGYGLAYAGLLGAMGYSDAVKQYNKHTIDPVINEAKKFLNLINQ